MKQRMQKRRRGQPRINYVSEDNEIVLQVEGAGVKAFMIEGLMCGEKFKAIIDTGLPVSIFAFDELKKIIAED